MVGPHERLTLRLLPALASLAPESTARGAAPATSERYLKRGATPMTPPQDMKRLAGPQPKSPSSGSTSLSWA